MVAPKRIGIIGAGTISKSLIRAFTATGELEIAFILVRSAGSPALGVSSGIVISDLDDALSRKVDLVIEAAVPEVAHKLAPIFIRSNDFCAFSCTTLADADFERDVAKACHEHGRSFFVPHGAILGLDGLADGRDVLTSVIITTTKNGPSLGLPADAKGMVFEGTAREACQRFPRNVNVHAAIAAAGIGFDRTTSRIIAAPASDIMNHRVAVEGPGLNWEIAVSSHSLGGVTGSYTPLSAVGSVRRILGGSGLRIA